ncbi:Na+/H+ antiporter subunit E [Desulfospira joergensenii]|uniref:Na+/H+ antiporter subunit E n=1 Tax=Desulfospira joergensenii TaxID=53329 RepID=UPI0003B41F3E|nr:Na+/H+ antiporter subunit E [Desulfospira joergensenii]
MTESSNGPGPNAGSAENRFSFFPFLFTFILMMITWVVLSGKFEPLLLGLGVISSGLVAWFFHDLLFPSITMGHAGIGLKFILYIPWLLLEIIKANFHLLFLVFQPRMKELIDPHIITFKTDLESDLAITTLANSITLTPGTITVNVERDGTFRVHAIDKPSAEALPGTMLKNVADIYGENQ